MSQDYKDRESEFADALIDTVKIFKAWETFGHKEDHWREMKMAINTLSYRFDKLSFARRNALDFQGKKGV